MFNMGFFEILLLSVVALFLIGPKDFPKLARSFSAWMNELKRVKSNLLTSLDSIDSVNEVSLKKKKKLKSFKNKTQEIKKNKKDENLKPPPSINL